MLLVTLALAHEATPSVPDFTAWDARMQTTLAAEVWHANPVKARDGGVLDLTGALFDAPKSKPTEEAIAWSRTRGETVTVSNLRMTQAEGAVQSVAFAVREIDHRGRMIQGSNTDVLVTYQAGVATHVYTIQVGIGPFETDWTRSMYTLERDAKGRVRGAKGQQARRSESDLDLGSMKTQYAKVTWTP